MTANALERKNSIFLKHVLNVDTTGSCYKDYLGPGNRSVFYLYSPAKNTFIFDVVQVITGSNLTSNVSFTETLALAHLKNSSPWFFR